jgi:hypothetical protein
VKVTKLQPFTLEFDSRIPHNANYRCKPEEMPFLRVAVSQGNSEGSTAGVSWNDCVGQTLDPARLRVHAEAILKLAEELEKQVGA